MAKKYLEINYVEIKKGNSKYTNPNNKLKPALWVRITAYVNAALALLVASFMVAPHPNPDSWTEMGQGMLMAAYGVICVVFLPTFVGMIKYLRHTTQGDMSRTSFVVVFLLNAITVLACVLTYATWNT